MLRRRAIEKHLFDADVVVKIFDVARAVGGAAQMRVQRGRGVSGKGNLKRLAQICHLQKSGHAAARGVGLQNVNGLRFEHFSRLQQIIIVFAGGNFERGEKSRRAFADKSQAA